MRSASDCIEAALSRLLRSLRIAHTHHCVRHEGGRVETMIRVQTCEGYALRGAALVQKLHKYTRNASILSARVLAL